MFKLTYIGQRRAGKDGLLDGWEENAKIDLTAIHTLVVRVWGRDKRSAENAIGYAINSRVPETMQIGPDSFKWYYNKSFGAVVMADANVIIPISIIKAITILNDHDEFINRNFKLMSIEKLLAMAGMD
jgi:hypothetical protein